MRSLILALALLFSCVASAAELRPRVALVLGGGGARGAAHIGVLEVLERERIPIDCVAGTSMGALVAGAFAVGLKPDEMRKMLASADWVDMFQDNPAYSELSYRNHVVSQRYLPGSETGVTGKGLQYQPGVVAGQKIKLFFNRVVRAEYGEPMIEKLSMPLAIIATDIGTGDRVVFRDGSLTLAMRASMSVPGLLSPVTYRDRKFVDGGLVDNLPVQEARTLCNADTVIAINVGSPLLKAEDVGSLISVSAQMINILTEQNVARSIASIDKERDIYLRPDLEGLGAGDFPRNSEIADRGRKAAESIVPQLRRLAVSEDAYVAWRTQFEARPTERAPISEVQVAELKYVHPEAVTRHLKQKNGKELEPSMIEKDLLRVYGDGAYESVDYSVQSERDKNILKVMPVEKSWGPDYMRFGMRLDSVLGSDATFSLRGAYHKTWLNSLGGELLFTGEVGHTAAVGVDWYQPVEPLQRFFVEPAMMFRRTRQDIYQNDKRYSEYQLRTFEGRVAGGLALGSVGQLRAGWLTRMSEYEFDTGIPLMPNTRTWTSGGELRADMDQFDRLYFPQRGWAFSASYFESLNENYSKVAGEAKAAHTWNDFVLNGQVRLVDSPSGQLPLYDAAKLGGFKNLSGFYNDQMLGDSLRFGLIGVERIVGRMPLGMRGDLRFGATMEMGRMGYRYTETQRAGWQQANAVYFGGETPFGLMYLGWGHVRNAPSHWYLFIGTP
ncbi:patatin-like phospholipase family protein [Uliginosibacterium aquaticum]|uniref:Patatin-like phospholipase family protein n=1 Tax=Uliginosibacterium aquaticum TaxID=2731212 RepID=A0ABX2IRB2_9RHOO|nr:patatin-like phospholipase family protein [Uliginosibacterium aquaticum]NSL56768.1 patatin-like phospholipase family protein [Uliginosibacterium aquaticum]